MCKKELRRYTIKPNPTQPNPICLIYMYKEDLALTYLQWLICHKTQPNQSIFFSFCFKPISSLPMLHYISVFVGSSSPDLSHVVFVYRFHLLNYEIISKAKSSSQNILDLRLKKKKGKRSNSFTHSVVVVKDFNWVTLTGNVIMLHSENTDIPA